ncbi:GntR family transcriptional regulator [Laceyella sacchari]|jgi:GntR family transcriptional regulator|uniref:GntR family transcriptional regulator n=1 Tax=Laceyella sacchari TaxID=37482 RepID=A0ABY5U7Y8_LACSH|nr:GntR family transcriptional regulator [Laceyella sacchari]UWE05284.1 GntR family transcriptional regulator [Laceyella sacchari]
MAKWEEIYEDIKEEILSGKMAPGSLFPSNLDLLQKYKARSTLTIQQAVNQLIKEGLVISDGKRGKHSKRTVRIIPTRSVNYRRGGFSKEFGQIATKNVLELRIIDQKKDIPKVLQDEITTPALFYHTEQLLNGQLVAVSKAYIPSRIPTQELLKLMSQANASLYGSLEYLGFKPFACEENLICDFASKEERQALRLPKNSNIPIVRLTRKTYDEKKQLVEICPLIYRADVYEFAYQFNF